MRGKKELLLLISGFVLFIADLVTDIYVAVQYKLQGDNWWFGLTLTFIIVPLFIINVMAFRQINSSRQGSRVKNSYVAYLIDNSCIGIIPICLLFSLFIIDRYIQELKHWKRRYLDNSPCGENNTKCNCTDCEKHREIIRESNRSAYKLAWIRYVQTLLESIPQWCLQVYIMLSRWSFPSYTVLSVVIGLLSLARSNTGLEKARTKKGGHDFNEKATVLYFLSQLAVLAARLVSMVTVAYAWNVFALVFMLVTLWLTGALLLALLFSGYMVFSICRGDKRCCEPSANTVCKKFILTIPLTFYVSETALESLRFTSVWMKMFLFLTKSLENAIMISVALSRIDESDDPEKRLHFDAWMPIAWSLFGIGFFFGLISLIVRHSHKQRREEPANPDTNSAEAQRNAYHIPESDTTNSASLM